MDEILQLEKMYNHIWTIANIRGYRKQKDYQMYQILRIKQGGDYRK